MNTQKFFVWAAGLTAISALVAAQTPAGRPERKRISLPREVLAFYYGWYGNPQISGRWYHWKDVDVSRKYIAESTHYPALGPYDSHDPAVVDTHCREAKDAGVTGFIVSWWRQGDFHDEGLPLLLNAAQKYGLKISAYYETVPPRDHPSVDGAVDDLLYLARKYGGHPAWLKIQGRPVFFIYGRAIGQLGLDGWRRVIDRFTAQYAQGAAFIGDRISPEAALIFDGIHTYNPTGQTKGKTPEQLDEWAKKTFPEWVRTAGANRISCITIIPGYDDSVQPSRKPPRPITERFNGKTYRILFQNAIAADPDWILITSWNEWHEGSEIEPSAELGERYLRITKEFAPRFLALRPRDNRR
ncbi:MAG TPA: glycoside hydrolase family 99-like domain-containing protein [Bryobacteraceae bacterium]|nr:glycoside hydrolase family 99-like domain-containing protein [Bryobacteraceae bacterium]